jgi:hypothetical protein
MNKVEMGKIEGGHAPNAWIAELLPPDVLNTDPAAWRVPTAAEIRVVVGVDSKTGITGNEAAHLVGVPGTTFRKYTASNYADHRHKISFSMWHLLLHRLGVTEINQG